MMTTKKDTLWSAVVDKVGSHITHEPNLFDQGALFDIEERTEIHRKPIIDSSGTAWHFVAFPELEAK